MVVLVPRQLQMTGMTGNVPYYGGRLSPAQAYAASHPRAAPPPAPPPPRAPTPPSAPPRPDPVEALDGLLESGVISEEEYHQLRDRLAP
ncbi:MAG: SHOCT domain-containing protein [Nocardioides sp.]